MITGLLTSYNGSCCLHVGRIHMKHDRLSSCESMYVPINFTVLSCLCGYFTIHVIVHTVNLGLFRHVVIQRFYLWFGDWVCNLMIFMYSHMMSTNCPGVTMCSRLPSSDDWRTYELFTFDVSVGSLLSPVGLVFPDISR